MDEKFLKRTKYTFGAPIITVELTDEMITELFETAVEDFDMYSKISRRGTKSLREIKDTWIKKYTIALCKETIGMIREKIDGATNIPSGNLKLEYESLLAESRKEKSFLISICLNK